MKATEQYFPVVVFIMLYKVVLTFESVDESLRVTIQMKATEQFFPAVLSFAIQVTFMLLHNVGLPQFQFIQNPHRLIISPAFYKPLSNLILHVFFHIRSFYFTSLFFYGHKCLQQ